MHRTIRRVLVLAVAALATWSLVAWGQAIEENPCRRACYEEQSSCVDDCGEHNNPVECEGECRDAVEDCLRECG